MSLYILDEKPYRRMHRPGTSPSLGLKIYLPHTDYAEMIANFIFDSGSCDNFLTLDTYKNLCLKNGITLTQPYDRTYNTSMANGHPIKFPYMLKEVIIKFEYGFPLPVHFIVNDEIERNIISLKAIRPYMRWVMGKAEFYILRRDDE